MSKPAYRKLTLGELKYCVEAVSPSLITQAYQLGDIAIQRDLYALAHGRLKRFHLYVKKEKLYRRKQTSAQLEPYPPPRHVWRFKTGHSNYLNYIVDEYRADCDMCFPTAVTSIATFYGFEKTEIFVITQFSYHIHYLFFLWHHYASRRIMHGMTHTSEDASVLFRQLRAGRLFYAWRYPQEREVILRGFSKKPDCGTG